MGNEGGRGGAQFFADEIQSPVYGHAGFFVGLSQEYGTCEFVYAGGVGGFYLGEFLLGGLVECSNCEREREGVGFCGNG